MAGTVSIIPRGVTPPTMLDIIGTKVTDVVASVTPEVVAIGVGFLVLVTGIAIFQRLRGVADDTLYHDEVLGQYDFSRNPDVSFPETVDSMTMAEYDAQVEADDLEDFEAMEEYEGRVATSEELQQMEDEEEYQDFLDENLKRG